MNIPSLGDFVVCETDIGYILGIYVRRIDHTTGAMGLCAEYVYERYRHRWHTVIRSEWDDVPLHDMIPVAHPEKGFYHRGVCRFVAFCAHRYPDTKWIDEYTVVGVFMSGDREGKPGSALYANVYAPLGFRKVWKWYLNGYHPARARATVSEIINSYHWRNE